MDCDKVETEYTECCEAAVKRYFKLKDSFLMKCCEDNKKCRWCEELAADEALKQIMKNNYEIVFRTSLGGRSFPAFQTSAPPKLHANSLTSSRCSLPIAIRK